MQHGADPRVQEVGRAHSEREEPGQETDSHLSESIVRLIAGQVGKQSSDGEQDYSADRDRYHSFAVRDTDRPAVGQCIIDCELILS